MVLAARFQLDGDWELPASMSRFDRHNFPRDKVCGGWRTPCRLDRIRIEPAEYQRSRVLQSIAGFRTGVVGGPALDTDYQATVSYWIRRREFTTTWCAVSDAFLHANQPVLDVTRVAQAA